MSLILYTDLDVTPNNISLIHNAESAFFNEKLQDSVYSNNILHYIEKASRQDDEIFIDRFNRPLYKNFLSTGTKAALLVELKADCIIDTIECGDNAVDAIIAYSKSGAIYRRWNDLHLSKIESNIDVIVRGIRYTSFDELIRRTGRC